MDDIALLQKKRDLRYRCADLVARDRVATGRDPGLAGRLFERDEAAWRFVARELKWLSRAIGH